MNKYIFENAERAQYALYLGRKIAPHLHWYMTNEGLSDLLRGYWYVHSKEKINEVHPRYPRRAFPRVLSELSLQRQRE